MPRTHARTTFIALIVALAIAGGCGRKKPPVARPTPPPPGVGVTEPSAPAPVAEPEPVVPTEPGVTDSSVDSRTLDEINKASPLQPVFYLFDSSELSDEGQAALQQNAEVMKKYNTWEVTVEGHCDERGTPEYNLALGERRALAARNYLVSLGIASERVKTVSYGKEFPFDPGHSEDAWAKNRRAHFVVTAK
jgi:peptidoglycan-associated lipoprotein